MDGLIISAMVDSKHIDLWWKVKVTSHIDDTTPYENIRMSGIHRPILMFGCEVIGNEKGRKYTDSYLDEGYRSK